MSVIKSVKSWVDKESSRGGKSKLTVLASFIKDYFRYGVNPKEYYMFHFDGKTHEQKSTFFTRKMFREFLKRNNDPQFRQILNDKYIFSQTYAKYIGRKCIRNTSISLEKFEEFMVDVDRIVYKPVDGSGGIGIKVIDKSNYSDTKQLFDAITALPAGVLESWIQQHDIMSAAYPHAVNCIRVATLFRDGKCSHLGAIFTLGYGNKQIANSIQGAIFALIDITTGTVISDFCNYSDEVYREHPDTGFVPKGFVVPYWKEIMELTAEAAALVPQVGYVGWDVAISKDGPVLIEGNSISAGYIGYQHHLLRSDNMGSRPIWGPYIN